MIYTIGNKEAYDHDLSERQVRKLGRTENFCGGSVWKTKEEARIYCREDQDVYGVLADWENDTALSIHGYPWHDLLIDSVIVKLEEQV